MIYKHAGLLSQAKQEESLITFINRKIIIHKFDITLISLLH